MRLPIEVVAQRPEEVIEVGDLVPQFLCHGDGFVKRFNLFVGGVVACCCRVDCCRRMSIVLSISPTCLSKSFARSC